MTRLTTLPDYGSDVSTFIIVRMHEKFSLICTFVYSLYNSPPTTPEKGGSWVGRMSTADAQKGGRSSGEGGGG
jgi:hypothetical protein